MVAPIYVKELSKALTDAHISVQLSAYDQVCVVLCNEVCFISEFPSEFPGHRSKICLKRGTSQDANNTFGTELAGDVLEVIDEALPGGNGSPEQPSARE